MQFGIVAIGDQRERRDDRSSGANVFRERVFVPRPSTPVAKLESGARRPLERMKMARRRRQSRLESVERVGHVVAGLGDRAKISDGDRFDHEMPRSAMRKSPMPKRQAGLG